MNSNGYSKQIQLEIGTMDGKADYRADSNAAFESWKHLVIKISTTECSLWQKLLFTSI